ncbi:MAG: anthranilate phosphoribosyltransferase [Pyrinomonadaceae bacterium]
MQALETYKAKIQAGTDLSIRETAEVFDSLRSAADPEAIAHFLSAWSKKGISADELMTCAKILRENCIRVKTKHSEFIDVVGTGGSSAKVFNVSTAAAFVIAGAGLPVAKHGNRAASSKTGSADALSNLGVNIVAETEKASECLDNIDICFMFAPKFHNLTKELAEARRSLGKPTIFNLLGPMANPANAPFQLIGIWNKDLMDPMAEAISRLGTRKTWIVHAGDGLDEITLDGKSFVAEVSRTRIRNFELVPEDFGIRKTSLTDFADISPEESSQIIKDVLNAKRTADAAFNIVLINAAAAIFIGGVAENLIEAAGIAEDSIKSGAAAQKLKNLIEETNRS